MKKIIVILALLIQAAIISGCSVVQATSGETKKDLSVLEVGTDRFKVVSELGSPVFTEKNEDGKTTDLFKFIQGNSAGSKAGKGFLYALAAVGTLGLSELVTSPLEGAIGEGGEMQVKVSYDENNKVDDVLVLSDGRWVKTGDLKQADEEENK
ncbi:hypothetical protein [Kangiella sp. HZ709]|uniref:hypothetical protein n=1 Tax=Kangiella sp. HZ709 TaxID=2666328 RepID=UPI0012AF17F0|nr:hypothetical protein [Kangiella sp. HZ709]MRX26526.1 hypothetical protein [Kangiella sp. HZ709]